jgi:hypothetical protein
MGHCMVSVETPDRDGPVPEQSVFGKTSPDGPVEEAWAKAMALDYGPFLRAWFALAANILGLEPDYRTPVAPEGGVQTLFAMREPARYETRREFEENLAKASVTWCRALTAEQGQRALDWINASPSPKTEDPRGDAYGFQSACCDWAVGAAEASGALDADAPAPLRTRLWVHEKYWTAGGPLIEDAWGFQEQGPYRHAADILTPSRLHAALAARPGWRMRRRV